MLDFHRARESPESEDVVNLLSVSMSVVLFQGLVDDCTASVLKLVEAS